MAYPEAVTVRVDEWNIQCRFNRARYHKRLLAGEFTSKTYPGKKPKAESGQAADAKTNEIVYFDKDNNEVARIHEFLNSDGTIGASGKHDPKELLSGGVKYRMHRGRLHPRAYPPETRLQKSRRKLRQWWRCWWWWHAKRKNLDGIGVAEFMCPTGWSGTIRVHRRRWRSVECDVDIASGGQGTKFRVLLKMSTLSHATPEALLSDVRARAVVAVAAQKWPGDERHNI